MLVVTILKGHKHSLQNAVNKVFTTLGKLCWLPTGSAYCRARQKLKPELFAYLNQLIVTDYHQLSVPDGTWQSWRQHRVLGFDGIYLTLPDTTELREKYTVQRNQNGSECVQALGGVLYDVRNDLGVAGAFTAIQAEKNLLFFELWSATRKGDIIVYDRNGADYCVIAWAVHDERHVVIRCPRQSFAVVNDFWESDDVERLVTLPVTVTATTRAFVRAHRLPESVTVRLLKFTLPSGETEVLLTTLLDRRRYPRDEFYQLYGWRWNEETYFDRLKNIFEVERFSGFSELSIQQDFHGILFLTTLESIVTKPAQAHLTAHDQERGNKTCARVNRAVSYTSLLDHVTVLLADPRVSAEETLEKLEQLFRTDPTRNPPGRKFERKKLKHAAQLRYHKYRKRINA